jgi:hypothetical protein
LRLDVDHEEGGKAYSIPKDNPFIATSGAMPEIWAFGFRNPWKISFDAKGRLWCGDVGWELWEMIHLVQRGGNHGWSAMEASQPIKPETKGPGEIIPPVAAHPHTEAASITGGYVYHGSRFPELRDAYIYGDYETGKIWALWHDGKQVTRREEIARGNDRRRARIEPSLGEVAQNRRLVRGVVLDFDAEPRSDLCEEPHALAAPAAVAKRLGEGRKVEDAHAERRGLRGRHGGRGHDGRVHRWIGRVNRQKGHRCECNGRAARHLRPHARVG